MFLLDNLLLAPGRAVMFLLEEVAKKAQEEFLDDDAVKRELQEIYAMLDAGRISEQEFEAREHRLVERLQQIAMAKLQEHAAGMQLPAAPAGFAALSSESPAALADPAPLVIDVAPVRAVFAPPPIAAPPEPLPLAGLPYAPVAPPAPAPMAPPVPSAPVSPPPATAAAPMTMAQVIDYATRGLSMLKLKLSTITSVIRDEGGWRVTAELVERRGVPDSSDLLGVYELRLDDAGNMLRYERIRMRRRCDLNR